MDATSTEAETNPGTIDCWRGCLIGGAVGDALGGSVEFMSRADILGKFGPAGITAYAPAYGRIGAITDDTQMTLFTAEGLLRAHVRSRMRGTVAAYTSVTAHALQRWLLTQGSRAQADLDVSEDGWLIRQRDLHHQRAPGMTCLSALRQMPDFNTPASNDSKGCGGVMRVAPVGMFAASVFPEMGDREFADTVFGLGVDNAALTHGHISGQLPAGVLALMVALLLRGTDLTAATATALDVLQGSRGHEETTRILEQAISLASSRPASPEALASLGEGWVAEEALAISLYCALGAGDFEDGVLLAINHSGDSDSTGAITGNLLGALHGLQAIPAHLLEGLELREVTQSVADDLATAGDWQISEYSSDTKVDYYLDRYPVG
ncbi:ADP-ribosylglycohydrolase [Kineobactrum sediminis]|uniref:ADP-ribosylglycohydrolase n=1 Tax=Kineobactrum sediminis TaxID=1905677 RepID=A0A2N5Y7F2_9GAMM|nr:ADP-ribosylglycohydrolase family protein [Kineobactrum sediminis]PLW84315.1 ADP-ribosylglycohydrolase [Kineobactrum sediminis]